MKRITMMIDKVEDFILKESIINSNLNIEYGTKNKKSENIRKRI